MALLLLLLALAGEPVGQEGLKRCSESTAPPPRRSPAHHCRPRAARPAGAALARNEDGGAFEVVDAMADMREMYAAGGDDSFGYGGWPAFAFTLAPAARLIGGRSSQRAALSPRLARPPARPPARSASSSQRAALSPRPARPPARPPAAPAAVSGLH